MESLFYLDTSIWLDFLEGRDEPNFPKGTWAKELIKKIIIEGSKILFSDNNLLELISVGYMEFEIDNILVSLKNIIFVEASEKEARKARDLAEKRDVPKRDALHALIARNNKAVFITLDNHFKKLTDIIIPHSPKDFI
jgi:predicted nucleic acid-binding protein